MIYGYVNSKQIIGSVFRDFGIQDSDFIYDAIEWIGEALEHIGTETQVVPKLKKRFVTNFRTALPKDMYILDTIRHFPSDDSTVEPEIQEFKYVLSNDSQDLSPALFEQEHPSQHKSNHRYFIDGKFIKTTFEKGWIALQYKGFALDEYGYPLVPDAVEYKEALVWFIIMKMLGRGLTHPVFNYEAAEQRWLKYAGQARNQSNMPDKGRYREFRDKWVTMVPSYDRDISQLDPEVTAENVIESGHPNKVTNL